jgi:3-hydroxybutyryl-CoA dehydrogenase
MDLVGLDLIELVHDYLLADLATDREPLPVLREHVAKGELGMKSGRGFYDWQARDPQALIERRDRQIARQLEFLREMDAL